uniref:Gustatory receptor n=1 Tax=Culicoides sonorensis TaxID=179676 RepID=A0A336MCQ0_CULSO
MEVLVKPLHVIERANFILGYFPVKFDSVTSQYKSEKYQIYYCCIVTAFIKILEFQTLIGRQPVADAIGGRSSSMLFYLDVVGKYFWTLSNIFMIINMGFSGKIYVREMNKLMKFSEKLRSYQIKSFFSIKTTFGYVISLSLYYIIAAIYGYLYIFSNDTDKFLWFNLTMYIIKSYIFLYICLLEYFSIDLFANLLSFYRCNLLTTTSGYHKNNLFYIKLSEYLELREISKRISKIFVRIYLAKSLLCSMIFIFVMYLSLLMATNDKYFQYINSIKLFTIWDMPFLFTLMKFTYAETILIESQKAVECISRVDKDKEEEDEKLTKQVDNLLMRNLHEERKFNAYGFFQVDNSLIFAVFSSIVTYLVILIQFKSMEDNNDDFN